MTLGERSVIVVCVVLVVASLVGLAYTPEINAWERANGYPFGRLCEVYRTC